MPDDPFLPTRPPRRTHETAEFWDGCAAGRLLLPRCDDCHAYIWYPRLFCPHCSSPRVTYTEVSGTGTVYSFTVVRKGAGAYREFSPYVAAYVELAEGPRVMTNIVGVPVDQVHVGQAVRVVFDPAGDADAIPRFTPS
ncbi:MAG: Zn-ribbon domain-containing OB-fold protein [Actinomycetota bacterium]|nr:Zn-ribbon domain-containing OB-fold protein [Actinomycetota bacterium]